MPGQFLWHTINDNAAYRLGVLDDDVADQHKPGYRSNYRMRSTHAVLQSRYNDEWCAPRFLLGDPTAPASYPSDDVWFEPQNHMLGGVYRPGFISGQIVQSDGVTPLAGVDLDLFLASTDAWVAHAVSDANGNYFFGTPFTGQQHEIYANYASGTYVGASVATLMPDI